MSEQNQNNAPGAAAGQQASASDTYDVSAEIQKLQEQAEKYKNDYLYLRAEFDNYKKHAIKERSEMTKFGAEKLVRDLLSVVDNFERALQTGVTAENFTTYKQGVEMTAADLKSLLQRHGVAEMKSDGVPFDPNVHEALTSENSDTVPAGHVLRVFQKAYKLHDKLIRPAQVIVAKKPE